MESHNKEDHIRKIIRLEDRIGQCNRCEKLLKCVYKPLLGKGDLRPQVILLFESESHLTADSKWVIELRNKIRNMSGLDRIYHTYLVRCSPKYCIHLQDVKGTINPLIDGNNNCLLTGSICDGIYVKPSTDDIVNCLSFTLEEIGILKPDIVVMFGLRASDYILKSLGIFSAADCEQIHTHDGIRLLATAEERNLSEPDLQRLTAQMKMEP